MLAVTSPPAARPVGVEPLATGSVDTLVGVSAKVVALGLDQIGGDTGAAVAIEIGQGSAHGRCGDAQVDGRAHDFTPVGLAAGDGILEEGSDQQIGQVGISTIGVGDVVEEHRSDDAARPPDAGDLAVVQSVAIFLLSLPAARRSLERRKRPLRRTGRRPLPG